MLCIIVHKNIVHFGSNFCGMRPLSDIISHEVGEEARREKGKVWEVVWCGDWAKEEREGKEKGGG